MISRVACQEKVTHAHLGFTRGDCVIIIVGSYSLCIASGSVAALNS